MQMKDEKETRKKLLICARTEFIQKGYMQASLRSICKNAGVTTGAKNAEGVAEGAAAFVSREEAATTLLIGTALPAAYASHHGAVLANGKVVSTAMALSSCSVNGMQCLSEQNKPETPILSVIPGPLTATFATKVAVPAKI